MVDAVSALSKAGITVLNATATFKNKVIALNDDWIYLELEKKSKDVITVCNGFGKINEEPVTEFLNAVFLDIQDQREKENKQYFNKFYNLLSQRPTYWQLSVYSSNHNLLDLLLTHAEIEKTEDKIVYKLKNNNVLIRRGLDTTPYILIFTKKQLQDVNE